MIDIEFVKHLLDEYCTSWDRLEALKELATYEEEHDNG